MGLSNSNNDKNNNKAISVVHPETEVIARPKRRSFSKAYKKRILLEVDACTAHGDIGQILRREGLYSSHLQIWRKQLAKDDAPEEVKRGPKPKHPLHSENQELKKKLAKTEEKLRQAEIIIETQKKISSLMEMWEKEDNGEKN